MPHPCVFISATCEDLRAYRAAARDAASAPGSFPAMMEYWPATAQEPLAECLARVDEAELLVVIVAHRYGWTPAGPAGRRRCARASPGWNANGPPAAARTCWPSCWTTNQPGRPNRGRNTAAPNCSVKGQLTPARVQEVQQDIAALQQFKSGSATAACGPSSPRRWTCSGRSKPPCTSGPRRIPTGWRRPRRRGASADRPDDYLRWVYETTCSIDIRGLQVGSGRANRFPIDELYIPLTTLGPGGEGRRTKDKGRDEEPRPATDNGQRTTDRNDGHHADLAAEHWTPAANGSNWTRPWRTGGWRSSAIRARASRRSSAASRSCWPVRGWGRTRRAPPPRWGWTTGRSRC